MLNLPQNKNQKHRTSSEQLHQVNFCRALAIFFLRLMQTSESGTQKMVSLYLGLKITLDSNITSETTL